MTNDSDPVSDSYLVVTGSSAGGIDALITFVGGLPANFGAPVVVAQHQAPDHHSRLAEILKAKAGLKVQALEGRTVLQPGTVYVVGSDRDVEVLDGSATVMTRARKGPKPSIDRLFATAAESHGDRLIAIIFSGMGSDGLAGARLVKEHGGTVIVQEPESASFPHMPLAIPPNLIDISVRPEVMGPMLSELVRVPAAPRATAEENVLRTLLMQLRDRSGVDFTQYKMPTITRRLSRLMVAAGVESIGEYLRYLQANPDAYRRLVSAFLIKVTDFFRDTALFDELRARIIPQLMADAKERGQELRIWSAGTSTGEEAYSLAILIAELLRETADEIPVRIFATDLDEHAIAFARRGLYSADALREIPPALLERYFIRAGEAYEVSKRIRNMTVFGQHDLGQRAPFPRIDLCLCRNVLIYFTKELQNRALQLFAFSLRDGGYLVVGKAESPGAVGEYFRVVDSALKIYQRQGERNLIPPTRFSDPLATPETRRAERSAGIALGSLQREVRPPTHEMLGAFGFSTGVGVVVVDRRYDIVALNASARTLLEIHGVGIGEDLLHLVRTVDPQRLRTIIDAAFGNEPSPPSELLVVEPAGGEERWLHISCAADRALAVRGGDSVALFIIDISASVGQRRELQRKLSEQDSHLSDLAGRLEELGRRQRALLQANDQLTDANAELRSANEQLLINAEEAASANEEIETLNEEMQATNEELETLNEELQATVEELNTSNDELEARGGDLERLAGTREQELKQVAAQRAAMAAVLTAIGGPFVVVRAADEEAVYVSDHLDASAFVGQSPGWSRRETIRLGGVTYEAKRFPVDGQPYAVVTLRAKLPGEG
ncbi:MAG: hypothetical protein JO083_08945 [Candidatus Eremiobacteraeota bacterium]|nr:hypothetical protein [Candidatus Eremiobacteraeota bacterium]